MCRRDLLLSAGSALVEDHGVARPVVQLIHSSTAMPPIALTTVVWKREQLL